MSKQVQRKEDKGDLRLSRRLALLQGQSFENEVVPPSWNKQRSIEASDFSRKMPCPQESEYNGAFVIA